MPHNAPSAARTAAPCRPVPPRLLREAARVLAELLPHGELILFAGLAVLPLALIALRRVPLARKAFRHAVAAVTDLLVDQPIPPSAPWPRWAASSVP